MPKVICVGSAPPVHFTCVHYSILSKGGTKPGNKTFKLHVNIMIPQYSYRTLCSIFISKSVHDRTSLATDCATKKWLIVFIDEHLLISITVYHR